jgi:hypothetical protein
VLDTTLETGSRSSSVDPPASSKPAPRPLTVTVGRQTREATLIFSFPCFEYDEGSGCSQAPTRGRALRINPREVVRVDPGGPVRRVRAWVGRGPFDPYSLRGRFYEELRGRKDEWSFRLPRHIRSTATRIFVVAEYDESVGIPFPADLLRSYPGTEPLPDFFERGVFAVKAVGG